MEEKEVLLRLSGRGTYRASMPSGELEVGEEGFRPMDLLLASVGGCSGVDVYNILLKKRQEVEDIQIEVKGIRREVHPRVYEKIKVKFTVKGKVSPKALEQAVKLSVEKYCSVIAMLNGSADVEVEFEVWEG